MFNVAVLEALPVSVTLTTKLFGPASGESGMTAGDPLHPGIVFGGTGQRCNLETNTLVPGTTSPVTQGVAGSSPVVPASLSGAIHVEGSRSPSLYILDQTGGDTFHVWPRAIATALPSRCRHVPRAA